MSSEIEEIELEEKEKHNNIQPIRIKYTYISLSTQSPKTREMVG